MDSGNPNRFNGASGCIGGRTCQSQGAGETLEEAACRGYRPGRDKNVGFIAVLKRSASKKISQDHMIVTLNLIALFTWADKHALVIFAPTG